MLDLVAFENVSCVHLAGHIVKGSVVAVGDDGVGLGLEGLKVVDHAGAEEGDAVLQRGFVHYDLGALGLDALHYALDGALAEVVRSGLHGEAVHAHGDFSLLDGIVSRRGGVVAGALQHPVGNVVFACAVAVHDGLDEVLGNVVEVGEQLLSVFGEAVAAVAEAGVVVVRAYARVEAHALDDGLRVEAFHLGVGVELVEVAHAQGQVCVGEELDRFGLGAAHEEYGHVLLDGAFFDDGAEGVGGLGQRFSVVADDDSAGVQIVVQRLALAEELRGEDDAGHDHPEAAVGLALAVAEFLAHVGGVADGHGGLDDHGGVGVDFQHQLDDFLYVARVEEVLLGVVIGGGRYDHELGISVGCTPVEGSGESQRLFRQVFLDVFVGYGADFTVDLLYFLGDYVNCRHLVMLRQQRGNAHAHISRSCYCDFHK